MSVFAAARHCLRRSSLRHSAEYEYEYMNMNMNIFRKLPLISVSFTATCSNLNMLLRKNCSTYYCDLDSSLDKITRLWAALPQPGIIFTPSTVLLATTLPRQTLAANQSPQIPTALPSRLVTAVDLCSQPLTSIKNRRLRMLKLYLCSLNVIQVLT